MKNWKSMAGIIMVFVLGMVAGGLVVIGVAAKRVHRVARGESVFTTQEVMRYLSRRLDLDDAQRAQVLPIVEEAQARLKEARRQCEPQVRAALEDAVRRTREVLRPEQRERFDALVAERQKRRLSQSRDE
jgi:hypothetical protein